MTTETLSHDELIQRTLAAARTVTLRDAAAAFVASLVDGPLRQRSLLGHLAFVFNLPAHPFTPNLGAQSYVCAICGAGRTQKIKRATLEKRLAEGNASIADLEAALVDLEGFARLPPATPSARDLACFDAMLAVIDALPAKGRATDLIKTLKVPKSNASARGAIVETLGACGLFDTQDHVGHLTRWIGFWEYEETPTSGDVRPPEAWWRRSDGVSRRALDLVFPFEGIDRTRFPERADAARPIEAIPVVRPKKGPQKALALRPGDVVAFCYQSRWLAGVVLGAHVGAKGAHPVIEFFAQTFATRPDPRDLVKAPPRLVGPFREAPHARREPLALEAPEFLGGVMRVKVERIAEGQAAIQSKAAVSPYRVVTARNLLYLMATLISPPPGLRP